MNWHYESNGQSNGPVSEPELKRLLTAGTITRTTLVWHEGLAAWTPLAEALSLTEATSLASDAVSEGDTPPPGWIRCTATGKYFPPSEIVFIAGKPYSLEAKDSVVQGVVQTGVVPVGIADRTGPAWEQRATLGIWKAGTETMKAVLLNPTETFAGMKREGGLGTPLLFIVIFSSIAGIIGIGYQLIMQTSLRSALPQFPAQPGNPFANGMPTVGLIAIAVLMPVLISLLAFVYAGIAHLSLMICGGARQPFETTFRTYCYSQGAIAPLQLIPICGAYIGVVWWIVSMCIGFSKTHEIGTGRAVLAVLLPVLVCCGGGALLGIAFAVTMGMAAKGH